MQIKTENELLQFPIIFDPKNECTYFFPGLDFAWSSNGYVYHTQYDSLEQIPLGSLQRTGDNILALALGMAQGHQLSNIEHYKGGNLVFFDFLGAFVVRWSMEVADLINILTVIISLYSLYANSKTMETSDCKYPIFDFY